MVKVMMNVTEVMVTFMWKSTIPTMTRMLNSYYSFPCTDVDSTVQSCTIYLPSIELDISALSNISSFYFLISFALSNCLAPPSDDDTLLLSVKILFILFFISTHILQDDIDFSFQEWRIACQTLEKSKKEQVENSRIL